MNDKPFPAILIGGPPHSGKSVLVYSLTRALRAARAPHYVLRACPDFEGDWANEADQVLVQTLRSTGKGAYSIAFIKSVAANLQRRHLPLLVDVGGRPTDEQEALFSHCTHAVLLIGDRSDDPAAYDRDTAVWQAIARRQNLTIIAHLKSSLTGSDHLDSTSPIVKGTITGLERGAVTSGPTFNALVTAISRLFAYDEQELAARHLAQAPVELTLDLPALARTLGVPDGRWQPQQLPDLLDYLPQQKEMALYGRAPNWIYTALALHAAPAPVWLFDARLGWIQPPPLPLVPAAELPQQPAQPGWQAHLYPTPEYTLLHMDTQSQYLDKQITDQLPLPQPPAHPGLILSGKLPHWLLLAAARQLTPDQQWLAVYQPPLAGAVIVYGRHPRYPVGSIVPVSIPSG